MTDFLKKIASASGGDPKRKIPMQDIIPKKSGDTRNKHYEPPSIPAPPAVKKSVPQTAKIPTEIKKHPELLPPELPIKQWQPSSRRHAGFPRIKLPFSKFGRRSVIFVGFCALVLAGLLFTTFFLAHLSITIRPISALISIPPVMITADTKTLAVSTDTKKIPALKISIEKTYQETSPATGKKYVEDFARGRITIFNAYSSAPQFLVRNTRFAEKTGKVFRLTQSITIPGAHIEGGKIVPSSIDAAVAAEKTGEEYNIPPADFTIPGFIGSPKFAAFYGRSNDAFSGGFRGEAQIVTGDDIKNSQEKVSKELFNQLKSALQEKMPSGDEFVSLDGSRNVLIEDIKSPTPNTRVDNFTTAGRGIAEMIVFKKSDLIGLLGSSLLSPDRPSVILSQSFNPTYKNIRLDTKNSQLLFSVEGNALAMRIVPTEEIKTATLNKRISEVETYLRNRPEISGFMIKNFPVWRWWAPSQENVIDITIEVPKNGG